MTRAESDQTGSNIRRSTSSCTWPGLSREEGSGCTASCDSLELAQLLQLVTMQSVIRLSMQRHQPLTAAPDQTSAITNFPILEGQFHPPSTLPHLHSQAVRNPFPLFCHIPSQPASYHAHVSTDCSTTPTTTTTETKTTSTSHRISGLTLFSPSSPSSSSHPTTSPPQPAKQA